jgi:flagellar FliJ protein
MFHFRLEPVLNYRKTIEDNLLKELSELKRQLSLEENKLKAMEDERDSHIEELGRVQRGGNKNPPSPPFLKGGQGGLLNIEDVKLYFSYLDGLEVRINNQRQVMTKCQESVDRKLTEVIGAMKNRKIMEVIKERGLAQYKREVNQKEQRFLDEIAVNRFVRERYAE